MPRASTKLEITLDCLENYFPIKITIYLSTRERNISSIHKSIMTKQSPSHVNPDPNGILPPPTKAGKEGKSKGRTKKGIMQQKGTVIAVPQDVKGK